MTARLFRVILGVSDIEKGARFYSKVLEAEGQRVSEGRHYFDCGGTILALFDARADGDNRDAQARPEHIYFAVSDLEKTRALCREAGAPAEPGDVHGDPAGEIAKRPWGERSFYVRDPFGNPLCFVDEKTLFTRRPEK